MSSVQRVTLWDDATNQRQIAGVGSSSLVTGQVAVPATPATAVQIVAARAGRKKVTLSPLTAVTFVVGMDNTVTQATGLFVPAGASVTLDTAGPVFAQGSAAVTVSFAEYF